jgi:replication-associated recombination protein RarA
MTQPFDPWTQVKTRHGLAADEVISALQKEIRRGRAENAALLAHEMIATSPELERTLWDRLSVISVEDVGFGESQAPVLIHALERLAQRFDAGTGDRALFAIHAVRYLAARPKDRSTDEMYNWLTLAVEREGLRPEIPDYALDMHTARGAAAGRGLRHFLEEGARTDPELPDRDVRYRARLLKILKEVT